MRFYLIPLICLSLLGHTVEAITETESLHKLFDEVFHTYIQQSPESGTIFGLTGYDHLWNDLSHETIEKQHLFNKLAFQKLKSIDLSRLKEQDQLDTSILSWYLKNQLNWIEFKSELMPITQQHGPHFEVSFMLQLMPTASVENYENILSRLKGVPKLLKQTIAMMEEGKEQGITPPQVTLGDVPASILKQLPEDPEDSLYYKPFKKMAEGISEGDRSRLRQQARDLIMSQVYPAMRNLHDYFVKEYYPNCRTTTAMRDLPKGEKWYAQAVRSYTTTSLTPDEIHQIGLNEVKRIHKEMKRIIAEISFTGDLSQFFTFMRNDPKFTFAAPEELLEEYRRLVRTIETNLPNLFGRLPKIPCKVEPIPHYSEKTAPGAYYMMGAPKTGRPGVFYVNTYDLRARPKWETVPLALHEALPGHHMQLTIAMENETIPKFRLLTHSTAYIEGWGLYSEGLGAELGLSMDPYTRFGVLSHELFRAVRLVVDTGLHAKGWSREKAIGYFLATTCLPEHDVISEVNRYIVRPAQALAYKIGQMHILKLRQHAKIVLGDRFDIRAFHDALLEQGDMPLNILEQHMHKWIAAQMAL